MLLVIASNSDLTQLATLLIRYGFPLDAQDPGGFSATHYAALRANPGLLRALIEAGSNVSALSKSGETALVTGARTDRQSAASVEVAKLLLDSGVSIDHRAANGATALNAAVQAGNRELARFLLGRGARADIPNQTGWPAAAIAIMRNDSSMLQLLVEMGAGLDVKLNGRSLAEFARSNRRPDLARMLDRVQR